MPQRLRNPGDTGTPSPPCNICNKKLQNRHKFVTCSICKHKSHIKCNNIEYTTYNKMKNTEVPMCISCNKETLPFFDVKQTNNKSYNQEYIASEDMKFFFNSLNDMNNQHNTINNNDTDNIDINLLIDCSYLDIESFKIHKTDSKKLSIIHLNIASLAAHKEELEITLSQLNFKFDVIALSETKIKKDIPPKFDIKIDGYKEFSIPTEANKGGVILYISNNFNSKPRKDLNKIVEKSCVLESVFAEIVIPNKKNIILGCIYRHPSMILSDFNENYLNPLMEKFDDKKHTFLMGDFNVDLMKSDEDEDTTTYFDTITSNLFVPHIIQPTRITPHSKTLIDNIFSNVPNFSQAKSGNLTLAISDHLAQFLIIPLDTCFKPPKITRYKRDMKNFDRENFFLDLLSIEWNDIIQLDNRDPELSFQQYFSTINSLIDNYMPLRKMTTREIKQQQKPWINHEILNEINLRDSKYKKWIHTKHPDTKAELHEEYKTLRNKIRIDIQTEKKKYFEEYFAQNSHNMKHTWKAIKSIIHINGNNKSQSNSLIVNKELITDPKAVAETFNDYFTSIADNLQSKIRHFGKDFSNYLKDENPHSLFIKPTNITEVINNINDINSNKALGPTSIPTNIFHQIKLTVAKPLADIINLSFEKGTYINMLKISKVIPIFKDKGSDLDHTNFRPISLLSNINKIVEKIMHERLYTFLEKYKCIYEFQFGFRKGHSTTHALLDLTEEIRQHIDSNKFAIGVFIDLQKAFDTVDHHILLKKLHHYGVRGIANKWFESYLSNRQQFVTINGENSSLKPMQYGVPQGSVLGPLLFLVYINDLNNAVKYSKTRHFADDTNLLLANTSLKQLKKHLNLDLKALTQWLKANKISLNAGKTEILVFRNPKKPMNYDPKIKIDGKRIYPSKYVKYLGILIDAHLTWQYHIKTLVPKLTRAAGMISKIRHFVPNHTLKNIYYAIFSSIMNYGATIWGQNNNEHINRITKLQDRAIRYINFANYREPPSELYKNSGIIKFKDEIKINNFLYVHDSLNRRLPSCLNNNFNYMHIQDNQHTRNVTLLNSKECLVQLPKSRTIHYGIQSIKDQSARAWNYFQITQSNLKLHTLSRNNSKAKIKAHILESY